MQGVIDALSNATRETVRQLNSRMIIMGDCMSVQRQFELNVDKVHTNTSYLDLAYMHFKPYGASFVLYKTSIFSAVSLVSSGFVPPSFLIPNQLTADVKDFTAEEIQRGSKLTPANQVSFEVVNYEVRF